MAEPPDKEFLIEGLSDKHHRPSFTCGDEKFDHFLYRYALQAQDKDLSRTFVLVRTGEPNVLGYFTLAIREVQFDAIPYELVKRLPRHPVPVVHLAMLAVHKALQRGGLGKVLVIDALRRARETANMVGIHAVDVEAYDDRLADWYRQAFGFIELKDSQRHLFLSMREIRKWLSHLE